MDPAALYFVRPAWEKKSNGAYFMTQSNTNKRALIVRSVIQGKRH